MAFNGSGNFLSFVFELICELPFTKDKKVPEPLNAKALFVGRRQNIKSRPLSGGRKIRWIAFLGGGTCGQGERLSILIIRTSHLFNFCFIIFNCPHQMIWSFLPLRWSIPYLMRKWHRVLLPCFKKFIETRTFQMQGRSISLTHLRISLYCESSSAGWLDTRGPMTRSHWARTAIQDMGQKKASRWEQR